MKDELVCDLFLHLCEDAMPFLEGKSSLIDDDKYSENLFLLMHFLELLRRLLSLLKVSLDVFFLALMKIIGELLAL